MLVHSLVFAMLAQLGSISGQVREARTHGAIRMASVELWNSLTPVDQKYTDVDGRFQFTLLVEGPYTITVSYSGYEPVRVQIDTPTPAFPVIIELVRKKEPTLNLRSSISVNEFLVPKSARKQFSRAREEVQRNNCAKAVDHFQEGLRIFDQDASAHNDLGNCYRKLGHLGRAEESFQRARALSDSVYVALNLAEVYTAQKRFEDAESVLIEAAGKAAYAGDAYYGLALVYFQQNRLEEATAVGLRAHEFPHQIVDVHLVLADLYLRKRKSGDAQHQLETYLQEAPNGPASEAVRQLLKSGQLPVQ